MSFRRQNLWGGVEWGRWWVWEGGWSSFWDLKSFFSGSCSLPVDLKCVSTSWESTRWESFPVSEGDVRVMLCLQTKAVNVCCLNNNRVITNDVNLLIWKRRGWCFPGFVFGQADSLYFCTEIYFKSAWAKVIRAEGKHTSFCISKQFYQQLS